MLPSGELAEPSADEVEPSSGLESFPGAPPSGQGDSRPVALVPRPRSVWSPVAAHAAGINTNANADNTLRVTVTRGTDITIRMPEPFRLKGEVSVTRSESAREYMGYLLPHMRKAGVVPWLSVSRADAASWVRPV